MARAADAAGRAARQLRLRRRGAAPRRDSAAAQSRRRRHDGVLAARADWLVCKEVCIPGGRGSDARAAGGGSPRRPTPRWGPALAAARAALPQPLAGWQRQRDGQRHDDRAEARAAGRRRRSRSVRFFPYDSGPDRPLGAAARHARRRCLRADVAGRADALGPARPARRRGHGRRRFRRGARGDDRRRGRRQRRARGRRPRPRPRPRSISPPPRSGDGDGAHPGARRRVGARRRLDPQSHALRLPRADAQGPGLRDAPRHATDDAAGSRRVRGRRRADVRRARRGAGRTARRRRAARLGVPAAIARRSSARWRSSSSCWR